MSRVPVHSCSSTNFDGPGFSASQPQLTTSGSTRCCISLRAYKKRRAFGRHQPLVKIAAVEVRAEFAQIQIDLARRVRAIDDR